jgi:hypothetical protein
MRTTKDVRLNNQRLAELLRRRIEELNQQLAMNSERRRFGRLLEEVLVDSSQPCSKPPRQSHDTNTPRVAPRPLARRLGGPNLLRDGSGHRSNEARYGNVHVGR